MNSLLKKIKEYFTPHQENDYKPHFSATTSILFLSGAMVSVFLVSVIQYSAISHGNNYLSAVISSTLVDITNENRIAYGKGTLVMNPVLMGAAQAKADDMAVKSYFAHTSPEGVTPWYWFKKVGYTFSYAGENLAVNFSDSIDVGEAWMNSPGHRANILNDRFTEIGIATSQGVYKGEPTIFVVQLFGKPAVPKVAEIGEVVVRKETITTPSSTTTPTEVAGATLETITVDDMFIAVKDSNIVDSESAQAVKVPEGAWISRFLVSPKTTLTYAYIVFGILIVMALALDTFIEIRRRHRVHLVYALLLWVLLFALLYLAGVYVFPTVTVV